MSKAFFLTSKGAVSNPEELVRHVIAQADGLQCGTIQKAPYLELAERIVRAAVSWQDASTGRILDPYEHKETPTVTARFIGALMAPTPC